MGPEDEPGILALLFALAAALYAVTWLIAGPSAFPEAPVAVVPIEHAPSVEVASRLASAGPLGHAQPTCCARGWRSGDR
jgi:hypothetical protein